MMLSHASAELFMCAVPPTMIKNTCSQSRKSLKTTKSFPGVFSFDTLWSHKHPPPR